jgi:hypothetical protein
MSEITVPVPVERIAEFYQFFGLWLAGSLKLPSEGGNFAQQSDSELLQGGGDKRKPWTGSDDEFEDAVYLWGKYNKRARAMFSLLMESPGKRYTGNQIAEAAEIPSGANGVAGVLAWPARFGMERQRFIPSNWKDGENGSESVYWMEPEIADLFKKARAKVED